jgi:omega-6 fatty acid desaturase (delta-12 desaturase)
VWGDANIGGEGFYAPLKWYFGPLTFTNLWLVLYTWLHHTHSDVPHFGKESFSWLRGATCTIDRPYSPLINHLHHHIGSTHVLHHLNSKIPHYHSEEATLYIRKVLEPLGLYRYDPRPLSEALLGVTRECEFVGGVEGVQFYRAGAKGEFSMKTLLQSGATAAQKSDSKQQQQFVNSVTTEIATEAEAILGA